MAENEKDIEKAEKDGMKASLIDRLRLTEERIAGMAEGLRQIADLEDPCLLYTSPSPRDRQKSRMPSSA